MNIKNLVENPHPNHQQYCNFWNFLLESYEGGIDYARAKISADQGKSGGILSSLFNVFVNGKKVESKAGGNLFQHPKELAKDYQRRLEMSYYYNFCGPIIDIYNNHLFKQPVTEDWGGIESIIKVQESNIDRKAGSIAEFRKQISDFAQIYGHTFVVCDKPAKDKPILSFKDQVENNFFPYFTMFHPQNVLNWSLDSFGFPYWVLLRETEGGNDDPANFDPDRRTMTKYRLWTRDEWLLFNSDYAPIANGTNPTGQVPITCVFDKQSKKARNFLGISFIADISLVAREIYNSCSELKQILRDQTFAFLAIQGSSGEYDELSIGTGKGLLYPPERDVPSYISPPTGNAEIYFKHIDRQVGMIFKLAKLEPGSAEFEGQGAVEQSGVSKAWDFNMTNSALSQKAANYEDGENKLWGIFAKWEGKEFDGSITYPREFSIQDLNADLDEAEKLFKMQIGETFEAEIRTAIIKKKFPRANDADVNKMLEESKTARAGANMNKLKDRVPGLFKQTSKEGNA